MGTWPADLTCRCAVGAVWMRVGTTALSWVFTGPGWTQLFMGVVVSLSRRAGSLTHF